jgi:hypothetical protein
VQSGDLVFCHSKGIIGASIRWAQKRFEKTHFSQWNHVAVLHKQVGDDWTIIQAEAKGVTSDKMLSSVAPGGTYEVVLFPADLDRVRFMNFLLTQVGSKYGFLSIFSCALDMALPDAVCLRKDNTWICSGLVAGALWFCGFAKACDWGDLYTTTPAEVAAAIISNR